MATTWKVGDKVKRINRMGDNSVRYGIVIKVIPPIENDHQRVTVQFESGDKEVFFDFGLEPEDDQR